MLVFKHFILRQNHQRAIQGKHITLSQSTMESLSSVWPTGSSLGALGEGQEGEGINFPKNRFNAPSSFCTAIEIDAHVSLTSCQSRSASQNGRWTKSAKK